MAKVTLVDLTSLESQTTAIEQINANFQTLADAIENTLSLDGTAPNSLGADIDLNSNRLLNLPSPIDSSDPVRLVDLQDASISGLVVPSLSGNTSKVLSNNGTTLTWIVGGTGDVLAAHNLSDLANVATARTNLGLGTASLSSTGTSGATVPLLNGTNTWSAPQTISALLTLSAGLTVSTGEVRLSDTNLGTINTDSAGFRGLGPVKTEDTNYTFALNDAGTAICHTSGSAHSWTVPPNIFPVNTVLTLRNRGAGNVSILRGMGVTMRADNSATNVDLTLAQWGTATVWQEASNVWVVFGSGLS